MKTLSSVQPEEIVYMEQRDETVDLWLHKNIEETTDEDGGPIWEADEVYVKVAMTREEVEENFDAIFEDPDSFAVAQEEDAEEAAEGGTEELLERIQVLKEAVMELGGLYSVVAEETKGLVVS